MILSSKTKGNGFKEDVYLDTEEIESAINQKLRSVEIIKPHGRTSLTALLNEEYVIKLEGQPNRKDFNPNIEKNISSKIKTVRVPEYLLISNNALGEVTQEKYRFAIMTKIYGSLFDYRKHDTSVFSTYIIPFLNEIHSINLNEKNYLNISWNNRKRLVDEERFLSLSSRISQFTDYLGLGSISNLISDIFSFFKNHKDIMTVSDAMCHGDLQGKHIYYNNDSVGIIDFGSSGFGNKSVDDRYILFPGINPRSSHKPLLSHGNIYKYESTYNEYLNSYSINQLPLSCMILNELLLYWSRIAKTNEKTKGSYRLFEDNKKALYSFSERFL